MKDTANEDVKIRDLETVFKEPIVIFPFACLLSTFGYLINRKPKGIEKEKRSIGSCYVVLVRMVVWYLPLRVKGSASEGSKRRSGYEKCIRKGQRIRFIIHKLRALTNGAWFRDFFYKVYMLFDILQLQDWTV